MPDLKQRIYKELDDIKDPCSLAAGQPMGLSEMGLVKEVQISADGEVAIALRLTSPFCHMIGFFKTETVRLISALPDVKGVTLIADDGLDWSPENISPAASERRKVWLERFAR